MISGAFQPGVLGEIVEQVINLVDESGDSELNNPFHCLGIMFGETLVYLDKFFLVDFLRTILVELGTR